MEHGMSSFPLYWLDSRHYFLTFTCVHNAMTISHCVFLKQNVCVRTVRSIACVRDSQYLCSLFTRRN